MNFRESILFREIDIKNLKSGDLVKINPSHLIDGIDRTFYLKAILAPRQKPISLANAIHKIHAEQRMFTRLYLRGIDVNSHRIFNKCDKVAWLTSEGYHIEFTEDDIDINIMDV